MAGKPLNRMDLRRQHDAAEPLDPMEDEAEDTVEDSDDEESEGRKPKKKAKAPSKAKAKAVKVPKPSARMRIVWTVMNDAFKQVGLFEYNQKEAADARAAELTARGKGTHFVMKSKEPMPDNAPGIGAAIPREVIAIPAVVVAAASVEDEEEIEEDEEADAESDSEEENEAEPDDE